MTFLCALKVVRILSTISMYGPVYIMQARMTSHPAMSSVRILVVVFVCLMICLNTATPAITETIPIGRYMHALVHFISHVLMLVFFLSFSFRFINVKQR